MVSAKIQDLEIAIAHQDKVIAELSDVMNDQWREIEVLKKQLIRTNNKIDELEQSATPQNEADVKPPHW